MTVKEFNEAVQRAIDVCQKDNWIGVTAFQAMLIPEEQPEPKQDWTPEIDGYYYYIGAVGIFEGIWSGDKTDLKIKSALGIYRTREEVEAMLEKLKKLVRGEG